jgi:hypothetical protein
MKSALIDILSTLVVQVEPLGQTFPVDSDHKWVDCPDDITANNFTYVNGQFIPVPIPEPVPPTADENKQTAIANLRATDWAATVDISNPQYSNPYLANQDAFLAYRSQIRNYAVNPVAGFINWPAKPTEVWTTV